MPAEIRVLVVDDSALIRQILKRALSMDPRIVVVGTARTGVEAIELARALEPDVVTLDIEMPELTGLEALPHIRKHTRARVVMLSSLDDPDTTYRALSLGAIDFVPKPTAGMAGSITELSEILVKAIKTAYRITPERAAQVHSSLRLPHVSKRPHGLSVGSGETVQSLVVIAASTGGPPALERVFAGLTREMHAAYVVVQHLPAGFSSSLARRLSFVSDMPVLEIEDGMELECGKGYIAAHGRHVEVERLGSTTRVRLTDSPSMHGVRPAADPLFASAARVFGPDAVAVVLTGMGADGAQGSLMVKEAGGEVVVQNEETSVVWGMPGAAMRLGAAFRAVPVGTIAAEVRRAVRSRAGVPADG